MTIPLSLQERIARLEAELTALRAALKEAGARADAAESALHDVMAELVALNPDGSPPSTWQRFAHAWKEATKATPESPKNAPEEWKGMG